MTSTITSQGSQQEQLDKLHAEVEALRRQLRDAQRLAAVGTMTAMVAHEFNNILTPIVNYANLARKNPALTEKAIRNAADGGRRASEICQAILGIAKGGSAEPVEANVAALIDETLSAMARDFERDGIEFTCDCPVDLTLHVRPVELQQVMLNLLINARAAVLAGRPPKRIAVTVRDNGDAVTIAVSDTGEGIAPENIERIFEPFFSTKSDAGANEGYGLGLAVCRDILTAAGGEISVESTPDDGATFTLSLPK